VEPVSSHVWNAGPEKPELLVGRVDVWRISLDAARLEERCSAPSGTPGGVLAPDELAHASRFHFDRDRVHYVGCRTALRFLLARYLDIAPPNIRFTYTPNGKPELAADQNPRQVRFNVSHSDNMALIAVGVQDALGVDIEKVRPDVKSAELSERFFSAAERTGLRSLPEAMRVAAFYACWARKEAFLKAIGEGLGFPLEDFSVSVHPEKQPRIEEIRGDTNAGEQWSLVDVDAAPHFRSAVAVERAGATIATFELFA
jgi:4'-phosphopantetheinyl transferase